MELLIVIAIIAILAAAIIVGINPARYFRQARDSTRLRHMETIATAVYGYAIEHGGTYPADCIGDEDDPLVIYPADAALREKCELDDVDEPPWCEEDGQIVPAYLREVPVDPLECYFYQIEFLGDRSAPEGIMVWSEAPETWGLDEEGDPTSTEKRIKLTK